MRVDASDPITSRLTSALSAPFVRSATVFGVLAAAAAIGLAPAAAQLRGGDIGSRGFSVGPRMMSPGAFGARLDPTFRTTPGGGDATDTGSSASGGSSDGRKVHDHKTKHGGNSNDSNSPPRRARSGVPPGNERRYVSDEVVFELGGTFTEQQVQALGRRFRLSPVESLPISLTGTTFFRWRIPDGRPVPAVIRSLEGDALVRTAQPNYLYVTAQAETQSLSPPTANVGDPAQYALAKLRLGEAHGIATGDKVLVAVIDSGIDVTHPELAGVIAGQFDALNSSEGPHAHGTGVAGIIASHARLMGAAPSVRILAVRAFGTTQGSTFTILKGLDWAVSQNARVINMSFAGPPDPLLQRSLASARQKGVVLVAAAGNAGAKSPPLYPAADAGVIAVTATDANDKLFTMANRGPYVAVAAPGVDILMPSPGGNYWMSSGTSMAAAYVTGVAALLLERQPQLNPDAVRKVLLSTAHDLGVKGRDDEFGAGLTDAYQAVMSLGTKAADTAPPATARR